MDLSPTPTDSGNLELLSLMSQAFAASRDIDATLSQGLDRIARTVGAEGGALFLLEEDALVCHVCVGPVDISGLRLPLQTGIVGRVVESERAEIVRDVAQDPNFNDQADSESGFTTRSILCVPMVVHGKRLGAIELVNKAGGDGLFTDIDLTLLETLGSAAALALENARQAEQLVDKEVLQRELDLAAEIQRSLLPAPHGADYPVAGVNFPARVVSGDFFDFFDLADGRIAFNLADVSGKGMNAALLMAKTASLFRCLGKDIHDPGKLLARIDKEIAETVTRGMFVTMIGGVYDPRTGVARIANAGHEPALLFKGETVETFAAAAPPLGLGMGMFDDGFPVDEVVLEGGTLYVFTDGVTEGYLEDGSELGADGLRAIVSEHQDAPVMRRLQAVTERLARDGVKLRDDLTLLALDDALGRAMGLAPVQAAENGEVLARLTFTAKADRLRLVRQTVSAAAALAGCSETLTQDVVLAVDEACQNVIRHAYSGREDGEAILTLGLRAGVLEIELTDRAPLADLEAIKPRDLDDVRPGGLGTHFMVSIMDHVEYAHLSDGSGNVLRMTRKIV